MTAALLLALFVSPGLSDPGRGGLERSVRYHYANDLFAGRDYYYTQGMGLRWTDPLLQPFALPLPSWWEDGARRDAILWRYEGFTPIEFGVPEIQADDRPFASYMYLGHRSERRAPDGHAALAAQWSLGYIGPGVGGGEFQTTIHRVTGDRRPRGWHNQIQHDLVAQLHVEYGHRLVEWGRHLDVWVEGRLRAGTLRSDGELLSRLRLGGLEGAPSDLRCYLWLSVGGRAVAFDATLQGGVFSDSPHTLSSDDVRHLVRQAQVGLSLAQGPLETTFVWSSISPKFAGGRAHAWGQLAFTVHF